MWSRRIHLSTGFWVLFLFAAVLAPGARAAGVIVHFDKDLYIVHGPGEEIQAMILIDADPNREGDQPVPDGLYSFGVKMSFNPAKGDVNSVLDVAVPPELDYFGPLSSSSA